MRAAALALIAVLVGCAPVIAMPPQDIGARRVVYASAELGGANAGAAIVDGTPTVFLAPSFDALAPAAQWFVFAHELCHLEGARDELTSDCCAGRRLRDLRIPPHLAAEYLARQPAGANHPPGPARAFRLLECYLERGGVPTAQDTP